MNNSIASILLDILARNLRGEALPEGFLYEGKIHKLFKSGGGPTSHCRLAAWRVEDNGEALAGWIEIG